MPDMNLDMYSLKRQESGFEGLMRVISEVLLKHVEPDTIAHCVRALVHCTQHGPHAIQVSDVKCTNHLQHTASSSACILTTSVICRMLQWQCEINVTNFVGMGMPAGNLHYRMSTKWICDHAYVSSIIMKKPHS